MVETISVASREALQLRLLATLFSALDLCLRTIEIVVGNLARAHALDLCTYTPR